MTQTFLTGFASTVHRIDIPCQKSGFTAPPYDVHIKFLPPAQPGEPWTLLAHAAAGKPDALARWLRTHAGIEQVRVAGGLAPKVLRAKAALLPSAWAAVSTFVRVHHLNLAPDGHASWFVEGTREQVLAMVNLLDIAQQIPSSPSDVRCRPVRPLQNEPPISRRQFEALSSAVALGYYEIPHRLDLRALGQKTGISLGSISELLRRAEGAVLTHYVDSHLLSWPEISEQEPGEAAAPVQLARPFERRAPLDLAPAAATRAGDVARPIDNLLRS
jgi:hypothetical protein